MMLLAKCQQLLYVHKDVKKIYVLSCIFLYIEYIEE